MRGKVPANLFGSDTVKPQSGNTAIPLNSETVEQQNSNTVKPQKVSFYLEEETHLDKLDELARLYKKHTGRKVNRQDVLRKLIENSRVEDLL